MRAGALLRYKSPSTQLEPVKGCAHPAESARAWQAARSLRGGRGRVLVCVCACVFCANVLVCPCVCVYTCLCLLYVCMGMGVVYVSVYSFLCNMLIGGVCLYVPVCSVCVPVCDASCLSSSCLCAHSTSMCLAVSPPLYLSA
jgi:hypothetical protein